MQGWRDEEEGAERPAPLGINGKGWEPMDQRRLTGLAREEGVAAQVRDVGAEIATREASGQLVSPRAAVEMLQAKLGGEAFFGAVDGRSGEVWTEMVDVGTICARCGRGAGEAWDLAPWYVARGSCQGPGGWPPMLCSPCFFGEWEAVFPKSEDRVVVAGTLLLGPVLRPYGGGGSLQRRHLRGGSVTDDAWLEEGGNFYVHER